MKNFNKALVATAILAGLSATSAFAGTEACFEIQRFGTAAAGSAITAHDTLYADATCGTIGASDPAKVAYELTGELEFDFLAGVDAAANDLQIVYVPTTDIPPGTLITMELSNAVFFDNANQIHLVKSDGTDLAAVGSSDGTVDGTNTVRFITKSGVTIGAGTRLALSQVGDKTANLLVKPIKIKIENTGCTNPSSSKAVNIKATSAKTDGGTGYDIIGAISEDNLVVDISAQFHPFVGGTVAGVEVNAESADSAATAVVARTEFVYDAANVDNQLVAKQYEAVFKTAFYNRAPVLDQAITLDPADIVETQFVASADPLSNVEMVLWNGRAIADGSLAGGVDVEVGTTNGVLGLNTTDAEKYETVATGLFTAAVAGKDAEANPAAASSILNGATYNEMFYTLTNTDPAEIMNFNYTVNAHYTLDLGDAAELDHCEANVNSHKVGVNGAVLKVPYVMEAEGNWVRVTNEHDEEAEVTVDVFGESANGAAEADRAVIAVSLGKVPAKSSVVYMVPTIIEAAVDQKGYTAADGGYAAGALGSNIAANNRRHTLTFTVTAPRDSVHGVSVQKIIGGVDRVLPVLDQNAWAQ